MMSPLKLFSKSFHIWQCAMIYRSIGRLLGINNLRLRVATLSNILLNAKEYIGRCHHLAHSLSDREIQLRSNLADVNAKFIFNRVTKLGHTSRVDLDLASRPPWQFGDSCAEKRQFAASTLGCE